MARKKKKPKRRKPKAASRSWYDPSTAPDPTEWLDTAEPERVEHVLRFHSERVPKNKRPPSLAVHANVHVLVENQIAMADPIETTETLARLMGEGLSRHDAIHALGWLTTEHVNRALKNQGPINREAYITDLELFTVKRWLSMARS